MSERTTVKKQMMRFIGLRQARIAELLRGMGIDVDNARRVIIDLSFDDVACIYVEQLAMADDVIAILEVMRPDVVRPDVAITGGGE